MKKSNTFKKNDVVQILITDITDLGFGVGRADGCVVFVQDTVMGDVVEAKIIKATPSYLVGKAEKYIVKSDKRDSSRCSECKCKSCAYKSISYADECTVKEEKVRHIFAEEDFKDVNIESIIPSPTATRYRNKAQYPISIQNGRYEVGFYAPKTHRVTPVSDCPLTPKIFSEIIDELKLYFEENNLSVYNEENGSGLLRHVYLRKGAVSDEILLTLVLTSENLPKSDALIHRITEKFPSVVGILINVNSENTNVILGEKYIILFGKDYIYDTLCDVKLKITAPSFYQVNHDCAELLYNKAKELAQLTENDTLLDLYCGAGSIGLGMAKDVKELIGIEIIDSAVECAKHNASLNNITNAHFYTGDAKDTEKLLDEAERMLGKKIAPDVVILDPPRAGCDEKLVRFVSSLSPKRIVYISCNPKTLARDMKIFKTLGYRANSVTPVDMFPATGHVESVVCLTRRLDNELRERMN